MTLCCSSLFLLAGHKPCNPRHLLVCTGASLSAQKGQLTFIPTSELPGPLLKPTFAEPWHKPGAGYGQDSGVGWTDLGAVPTCMPWGSA